MSGLPNYLIIFSWLCCYMAQMNPLIGPRIDNKTLLLMAREWVSLFHNKK